MNTARAWLGAFLVQWRVGTRGWEHLGAVLMSVPYAVVLAWVAGESGNPTVLAYILVGAPMALVWEHSAFYAPFAVYADVMEGTAEITMTSPSPLSVVALGKAASVATFGAAASVVTFVTIVGITHEIPQVSEVAQLVVSVLVVFVSILAVGYVFSPLVFLAGRQMSLLFTVAPLGTVVSGFMYPLSVLPDWMQTAVRLVPTSWAMESVVFTARGGEGLDRVAIGWAVALGISVGYIALTALVFGVIERIVRARGTLVGS